jgi:hypothetical protein
MANHIFLLDDKSSSSGHLSIGQSIAANGIDATIGALRYFEQGRRKASLNTSFVEI